MTDKFDPQMEADEIWAYNNCFPDCPGTYGENPHHGGTKYIRFDLIPQDTIEMVAEALEKISARPDLPNPERDADWKNCQKWSAHDAKKKALTALTPHRKK